MFRGKTGVTSPHKRTQTRTKSKRTQTGTDGCSFPTLPPTHWRPYSPESTTHARFRTSLPCTPPIDSHRAVARSTETDSSQSLLTHPLAKASKPTDAVVSRFIHSFRPQLPLLWGLLRVLSQLPLTTLQLFACRSKNGSISTIARSDSIWERLFVETWGEAFLIKVHVPPAHQRRSSHPGVRSDAF